MKDFGKQQLSKQLKRIYAGRTLVTFTNSIIEQLRQLGKNRTGEIYSSALASFLRFNSGKDIALKKINPDIMMLYESYLQTERRITRNSSSFYMRVLRAIYNRAVEQGITKDNSPFKYVYIGVDRTVKRALHLQEIN